MTLDFKKRYIHFDEIYIEFKNIRRQDTLQMIDMKVSLTKPLKFIRIDDVRILDED